MTNNTELFSWEYSLQHNTVNIFGPIDDAKAELIIAQLQYLDSNGANEIVVQINSPGGSVSAGLAIYDTLCYIRARIVTIGVGMCASMGAFLLSAGSKGYRKVTENCEVLIHQPLGGVSGQASDIIIAADHIKRTRARINRILSENTGKPLATIEADTDRDKILTADEAREYGLVDKVIPSINKAKGENKQ